MEKNGSGQTDRQTLVRSSAHVLWVEGQTGEESLERQRGWTPTGTLPQRNSTQTCVYICTGHTHGLNFHRRKVKNFPSLREREPELRGRAVRAHTHTHSRNNTHAQRKIE